MGGKASLYMVLGFSLIFMVAGYNFSSLTRRAVGNEVDYFAETKSHDIAVSGANMAANAIFFDKNWTSGYNNLAFNGGTINVNISHPGGDKVQLVSIGAYQNAKDTVIIILQPSSFSKFAYYMNLFPGNHPFYTGDTVSGPYHTQQTLSVKGRPVFNGKATSKNGIQLVKDNPKTAPVFNGGFESGVDVPLVYDPNVPKVAAQTGGAVFQAPSGGKIDVKMQFNADGTMTFKTSFNGGGSWSADTTVNLSTFAPNGVIFVDKGNIWLQGTVNGRYTIVADQSSGMGTGNVYLENDIVYHNSLIYNNETKCYDVQGTDMLGIIAANNVIIMNNSANQNDINIHASIFCQKGGLQLQDAGMPPSGSLRIVGGVIEYQALPLSYYDNHNNLTNGYHQKIFYDYRLMDIDPPYFPPTGLLEVVSWFETTYYNQQYY
jgi:hypothetical protein